MELQIPHSVCAKISQAGVLQRKEGSSRENTQATVRIERGKNNRSRGVPRPHTYAGGNTTEVCGVKLHGYLKGKSSTMLYEQFGELKYKYRSREFWCRGYYVDKVGKNTSRIAEYIKNQLKEDEMGEQLTMSDVGPFKGSK